MQQVIKLVVVLSLIIVGEAAIEKVVSVRVMQL